MKVFGLLLVVAAASASVIDVRYCGGVDLSKCTVNEIRIEPCADPKACKVVKGGQAEISFDFTPNFSASSLKTAAIYQGTPWESLDADGCKATTCPTVAGTKQTYNVKMPIGKFVPKGRFTFEWSVTDANDEANRCCFEVTVKIVKK